MNVRDMIDLLGRYPEDMRVVVNGYEQGYDDLSPEQISVVPITLNTGEHPTDIVDGPRHVVLAAIVTLGLVARDQLAPNDDAALGDSKDAPKCEGVRRCRRNLHKRH